MVAGVPVIDVELLGASTDVVNHHGAAGAIPCLVVFESETGVGAEG